MAKIQLNGKKVKIQRNLSIKDLIKKYRLKENKIAIELNGTILPKDHYKNKKVKNNDKIEIVQFIGIYRWSRKTLQNSVRHYFRLRCRWRIGNR